ncbi:hypothetical protein MPSI1_003058 [Malassezia psittaci]|uniref:Large ribosomal subunit protein uL23m n=1 Tax=Malassezia psittaci TaxID=1821823 RepID=A0AAF0FBH4_9BASI|nr:hypothetical protein MPSI1_003058 [Malassezia psittaci]
MTLVSRSVRGLLRAAQSSRVSNGRVYARALSGSASRWRAIETQVATSNVDLTNGSLPLASSDAPATLPTQKQSHAQARKLLRWHYLEPNARVELESYLANASSTSQPPSWLASELAIARSYRTARSRNWLPSADQLKKVGASSLDHYLDTQLDAVRSSLQAGELERCSLEELDAMDVQEQADLLLLPIWQQMSQAERDEELLRASFESVRKLGWRSGYSAGYPGTQLPTPRPVANSEFWRDLHEKETEKAWQAWRSMSTEERSVEWDNAWSQRDRSLIYLDDSPTTRLLGSVAPRWFTEPQRAGQLQFLPNFTVRLVRNYTPAGQSYDPWKATFRVPLHLHKHALRSFLLAVYGLRTTWARSMVYRSRIVFNFQKKRRSPGRDRTFKKVEVGLLEPFVFPGLTKEFLRTHLFAQEMLHEERRLMLKMTKGRRWRARKSIRGLSQALDRNFANQNAGAPDEQPGDKPTAQLLTRSGSVPTARHGNILAMLSERRAERLARVQQFIDDQKKSKNT